MVTDGPQHKQRIKANYAAKAAPCRTLGVLRCETTAPKQYIVIRVRGSRSLGLGTRCSTAEACDRAMAA